MSCQVGNGVRVEEVTFLYRLRPGACPKSYGVNVARLAGNAFATLLPFLSGFWTRFTCEQNRLGGRN